MTFKFSALAVLMLLNHISMGQARETKVLDNPVCHQLHEARISLDTHLYESLFTWYLWKDYEHPKGRQPGIGHPIRFKYLFIPVLEIDEECFISINCDYHHANFYSCITKKKVNNHICALYSSDNNHCGFINFNNTIWYATDRPIRNGFNISGQKMESFNELYEYLGYEIFYMAGLFCKLEEGIIKAYIGNGVFRDFREEFGAGRWHSPSFAMGCR